MNTLYRSSACSASVSHLPYGTDAVILLGASCGGSADYAMIAEELGYGPLTMPVPCDTQMIRHQLESLQ